MSARIDRTPAGYVITTPVDVVIRYSAADAVQYCHGAGYAPVWGAL